MKIFIKMLLVFILLVTSCTRIDQDTNKIADNQILYSDDFTLVKEIYVTVLEPVKKTGRDSYTFTELNQILIDPQSGKEPRIRVIFQEGLNGFIGKNNYGYGITDYNGTIELRGQSAKIAQQKSYRIELNSKVPWDDYIKINLNKHPFDSLKIRNKLAFELIKDIPDITSARTQLVHLFIKDFSEKDYNQKFIDYGLFTQIENIDEEYLENHQLDEKGNLYKVENFEFYRYENTIVDIDDFRYDEEDFEKILEFKNGKNHKKLIEMLNVVNNDSIHINTVIDKYFNKDNFLTWLSINILMDNIDTASRNYFLYCPSDSNTWYFIPWDYDKGLGGYKEERGLWQEGISNYWGNVLINRFLKNEKNRLELTKKIEYVASYLNQKKVEEIIEKLTPIILEYLSRDPDKSDILEVGKELDYLKYEIAKNLEKYYLNSEKPMPVFSNMPSSTGNFLDFSWSASYDFQQDNIFYSIQISDSPTFNNIIYEKKNLTDNQIIIKKLPQGHYYYKINITDSKGNEMDAFDIYYDYENNLYYYGIKDFYITDMEV